MEVHEKVNQLRESKGVSQTFMAKQMELSVSGYNMKEHGKRRFSIEELIKVSNILGVQISYFFEDSIHVKCKVRSEQKEVI